jgi:hypothetical protein
MEDLGFILTSYVTAFGAAAAMAWWVVRRGRQLGAQVPGSGKQSCGLFALPLTHSVSI